MTFTFASFATVCLYNVSRKLRRSVWFCPRDSACINMSPGALSSAKTFGERERTCEFLSALSPPIRGTVVPASFARRGICRKTRRMFAESGASFDVASPPGMTYSLVLPLRTARAPYRWEFAKIPPYNTPVRNTACMRAAFKCRPVATRIRITVDLAESQNAFLMFLAPRDAFVCQVAHAFKYYRLIRCIFCIVFLPRKNRERLPIGEKKDDSSLCLESHIYFLFSTVCSRTSGLWI